MSSISAAPPHTVEVEEGGHAHPPTGMYLTVFVVLAVLTLIEITVSYTTHILGSFTAPALVGLAALKFVGVVAYYMHLRFDSRTFAYIFGFGLLVAMSIVTAFLFLFGHYPLPVHPA